MEECTVMAVVNKEISDESDLFLEVCVCGADAVGAAELRFEGGNCSVRVLARVGFNCYVSVRWFPVDGGGNLAIVFPL